MLTCTGCEVFLTAMGADETQMRLRSVPPIRIARGQKSISMAKRAEGTYAAYRRQKRVRQEDVNSDYSLVTACNALSLGWLWEVQRYQTDA